MHRYAGLLEDSERECDAALALDPGDFIFRSCSLAFMELGNTDKALRYLRLDSGSEFAANVLPGILLREGKTREAGMAAERMSKGPPWYNSLLPSGRPKWPPLSVKIRQHCWPSVIPRLGTLRPRRSGVDLTAQRHSTNYCAVSALNADPLWVRGRREFGELRAEANECQKLSLGRAIMSENTWWGQSSLSFAIL